MVTEKGIGVLLMVLRAIAVLSHVWVATYPLPLPWVREGEKQKERGGSPSLQSLPRPPVAFPIVIIAY